MAGTDSTRFASFVPDPSAPAVVLVQPQLGENVGMTARAMLNCGLTDLRLVAPRDGWPNEAAVKAASGATPVLERVRVFDTTRAAVADLNLVVAATARERDMTKRVVTARGAAAEFRQAAAGGLRTGFLFGPEAKGLNNDDVALADAVLQVPLNPAFSSLNLAQAVLLAAYEWAMSGVDAADDALAIRKETRPADREELVRLFEHLEEELTVCGFLYPPPKVPAMVRNLRNIFSRARLTEQEVRTLRGVIVALRRGPRLKKTSENKAKAEE